MDNLRKLAQAATPMPEWFPAAVFVYKGWLQNDADFLAALKPSDIRKLLDVVDKAREALEQIAQMDPKGLRADDLGRAARIARDALTKEGEGA